MNIHEAVDLFFSWGVHRFSQRTIILYTGLVRQFATYADTHIDNITVMDHIVPYAQKMRKEGRAETTINLHMVAIRQFWRFSEDVLRDGYGITLRMRHRSIPMRSRIRARSHKTLTSGEWAMLCTTLVRETTADIRDEALLRLLYATGLRVSELVALDVDDVDVQNREVIAITRKRRDMANHRTVPYTDDVADIMQWWLPIRATLSDDPALFVSLCGSGRISTRQIERIIIARCRQAGITGKRTPHSFRHAFGQRLASAQMYQPYLQQLLGHSSPQSSQVYYNIRNSDVTRAYRNAVGQ